MPNDPAPTHPLSRGVEIVEACGEWFVRVVLDGTETVVSFELESFARAYADGQRIRLGLERPQTSQAA